MTQDFEWNKKIQSHEASLCSSKDGAIMYILKNLPDVPDDKKFCLELGYSDGYTGTGISVGYDPHSNSANLIENYGWKNLFLDGSNENLKVNLHKEFLSSNNICEILKKYNVPKEFGFLSIDIDSCDIWVMLSLLKEYKPWVFCIEYNPNFPNDYAIAFPNDTNETWQGDCAFGSSVKALKIAAKSRGYSLLHIGEYNKGGYHDCIFVNNEIAKNTCDLSFSESLRYSRAELHNRISIDKCSKFIDFEEFIVSEDIQKSKTKAFPIAVKYLSENQKIEALESKNLPQMKYINKVELIGCYGSDQIHACSAWTSTSRDLNEDKIGRIPKLLKMLADAGHHTPFEKSSLHFLVDTDIASHIHLLKHRIGVSINGESARYKEIKEDKYLIPDDWKGIKCLEEEFGGYRTWNEILDWYTCLGNKLYHASFKDLEPVIGRKRAKESARFFKTYNSQIQADVMFNWRSFYHFLELRNKPDAQKEIREIAAEMLRLVKNIEGNPFEHTIAAFEL